MKAELQETRELVKVLHRFVGNYRVAAPRTNEGALRRAAGRVEEALIGCLAKATEDLGEVGARFECKACGVMHDLARDRATLASGHFRYPTDHGTAEERRRPVPDHVVLMRAFRYSSDHAKEVVRQLEARKLLPAHELEAVEA